MGASSGPRVVTLGETMALFYSEATGSLAHTPSMRLSIGGAESNVAIALARLGTPVAWIGRTGDDSLGERVERELRAEGVQAYVIVDASAATGLMLKERRTNVALNVYYYRSGSAGSRLEPTDIPDELIEQAGILHVTGITAGLSESAQDAVFAAISRATAANVPVSFDVNHRSRLWRDRDAGDVYRRIAEQSQIVFAGEDEAKLLVSDAATGVDLVRAIAQLGPTTVVLKLGARGALALVDGAEYDQAAIPIAAVDTVGAGDAFVAGYLSALADGANVHDRLKLAAQMGAFACLCAGDWEGLPRRHELSILEATEPVTR